MSNSQRHQAALASMRKSKAKLLHALRAKKAAYATAVDSDADTEPDDEQEETRAPTEAVSSSHTGDAAMADVPRQPLALTGVFDGATYGRDNEWLKTYGKGLFPNGIADLRPERLFLGARVTRSMSPNGGILYQIKVELCTYGTDTVNRSNYRHRISAGDLTLQFRGSTAGVYLALFYGNRAYTMDDSEIWERIWRRSTIDPRKYMTSVLRAFILTRLVETERLSTAASIGLTAVGGSMYNNDQRRLVLYYRSMGFVEQHSASGNPLATPMIAPIATFLHDTAHMARWTADFNLKGEPDDPDIIFPVVLTGATHTHI